MQCLVMPALTKTAATSVNAVSSLTSATVGAPGFSTLQHILSQDLKKLRAAMTSSLDIVHEHVRARPSRKRYTSVEARHVSEHVLCRARSILSYKVDVCE